jgi:hypothetical protein
MVPLVSWPRVRPYVTSQTYGYPRLPIRLTVGKGKYGSFVAIVYEADSYWRCWEVDGA